MKSENSISLIQISIRFTILETYMMVVTYTRTRKASDGNPKGSILTALSSAELVI